MRLQRDEHGTTAAETVSRRDKETSEMISQALRSEFFFRPRVWINRARADRARKLDDDLHSEDFQRQDIFCKSLKNNATDDSKHIDKVCYFFASGDCKKGSRCKFEHTQDTGKLVWQPKVRALEESSGNTSTC